MDFDKLSFRITVAEEIGFRESLTEPDIFTWPKHIDE
jgi:hypothetical protein